MKDKILHRLELEKNHIVLASMLAGTEKPWEKQYIDTLIKGIDTCIKIIKEENFEELSND